VGPGRLLPDGAVHPLQVKPGEKVLFGKYAGQTVKIHGQELLVIKEEDVLGIIEPGSESMKKAA
jgi:chaperonin GroES